MGALGLDHGLENPEVGQRSVEVVAIGYLDIINHVQAFNYLAKDGVFAIQMGRAAVEGVGFFHLGRDGVAAVASFLKSLAVFVDGPLRKHSPPNDVELRTTASALGIDLIGFAGSGHCSPLVEERGQTYLGRNRIAWSAIAKCVGGSGMARIGVARLYHKVGDDAMEEQAVVIMFAHQPQEIVAMLGRGIRKGYDDVAVRRSEPYALADISILCLQTEAKEKEGEE